MNERKKGNTQIYGTHAVNEALSSGTELNKIIIQKGLRNQSIDDLIKTARKRGIPVQFVPKESAVFPVSRNHQGIIATISPVLYHKLEDIIPQLYEAGRTPFILVLDHITDVRNFGAIARTAYCGGVHAIVVPEQGGAPVNEDAIKTSAGALMKIAVCRERNYKTVMELLNQSGIKTVGCTEKGNKDLPFVDLTEPVAIIMGSEETGISNEVLRKCSVLAKIPLEMGVSSLNVSVAASIAVYETVRQRMN